jgi:hypothetical protein
MAEGGNEKLLLDAIPLDDSGEYEIPDPRALEQLETYVPSCMLFLSLRQSNCRAASSEYPITGTSSG